MALASLSRGRTRNHLILNNCSTSFKLRLVLPFPSYFSVPNSSSCIFQVKANEKYPSLACRNCLKYLKKLSKFKETIVTSQEKLEQICSEVRINGNREPSVNLKIVAVKTLKAKSTTSGGGGDGIEAEEVNDQEEENNNHSDDDDPSDTDEPAKKTFRTTYNPRNHIANARKLTEEEVKLDKMLQERKILDCHICDLAGFKSFSDLHHHTRMAHSREVAQVRCCDKLFKGYMQAFDHMRYHLDANTFKCKVCMKIFSCGRVLTMHMHTHADPKECPYKCDTCGTRFFKKSKLNYHMKFHISFEDRPFKCEQCDQSK